MNKLSNITGDRILADLSKAEALVQQCQKTILERSNLLRQLTGVLHPESRTALALVVYRKLAAINRDTEEFLRMFSGEILERCENINSDVTEIQDPNLDRMVSLLGKINNMLESDDSGPEFDSMLEATTQSYIVARKQTKSKGVARLAHSLAKNL